MTFVLIIVSCVLAVIIFMLSRELRFAAVLSMWENERFTLISDAFAAANAYTLLPVHDNDYVDMGGGNIGYKQGPGVPSIVLNHETLVGLVLLQQKINAERQIVRSEASAAINALRDWERENLQPRPPTYFGHRFIVR